MNTLSGKLGKFSVDCMAISANAICGMFYSRYSSPGTSGVKFFRSDSLSGGLLFLFGQDLRYFPGSFQMVFMHPFGC
jgi:hypothetical protein